MSEEPRGWGAPLHEAVLDATGVGRGTRVLDLGCGTGLFARAAADRGARVTGVDLDADAVAQAAAEVPGGTFLVRHAQDPPPGPFDVVAAVQLLMHVADPVAVLRRAGRVGGVVAATVWGRDRECELRVLQQALASGRPARTPAVSEPARLRAMAERAGLVVEQLHEVLVPFDYADADELLVPLLATPLGRAATRQAGPDVVRDTVLEHLEPYRTGEDGYRLHNLFRVLVARPGDGSMQSRS
ncbi:class I SAM-dependent methyltransferase [Blastococcus sp. SYSU DS0753]